MGTRVRKLGWFVAIWAISVLSLALVGLLIRTVLNAG